MMSVWKFLHISCMFGAASLLVGQGMLRRLSAQAGNIAAIRLLPAWDRLGNMIAGPLFVAGIVFGFVTAVSGGFRLNAPWLVTAYVLVAVMLINGFGVWDRGIQRLKDLIETSPKLDSPELIVELRSPSMRRAETLDMLLWVAIIFTMVTKPFM